MAKPAKLCKLEKGKLLDSFPGFVDTWNFIVDWIENIKGEGEDGEKSEGDGGSDLRIDRTVEDHPVIRGGGSGSGSSSHRDKTLACGNDSNIVFTQGESNPETLYIDVYYV